MKTRMMWIEAALLVVVLWAMPRPAAGYYDPGVQRWINRDPIEEHGGANLYASIRNAPISRVDPVGHQDGNYDTDRCKKRCHDWACELSKQGGFDSSKALSNCYEGCDRDPKYIPGSPLPPLPTIKPRPPKEPLVAIVKECAKAVWEWCKKKKAERKD